MSLALYSCKSKEAQKLKAQGFEIAAGEDPDGNPRINITREDGGEVKYNNIYNKTEITAMNLANNLDKLEGFEDITIYKDGKLPSVNIDGKTNNQEVGI